MKIHVFRLKPGQDIKEEIDKYVQVHKIKAGVILSGVGNIGKARIRLANENIIRDFEDEWGFEIVSVTGTISVSKNHIHISFSDKQALTYGGHIKEGCIVRITAEIVIGEFEEYEFVRSYDEATGFDELVVNRSKSTSTSLKRPSS